ncbi:MAG: hypothetical protein ACREH8_07455 [Opitutaceae bacterium]
MQVFNALTGPGYGEKRQSPGSKTMPRLPVAQGLAQHGNGFVGEATPARKGQFECLELSFTPDGVLHGVRTRAFKSVRPPGFLVSEFSPAPVHAARAPAPPFPAVSTEYFMGVRRSPRFSR